MLSPIPSEDHRPEADQASTRPLAALRAHPLAQRLPRLPAGERAALRADIDKHGVVEPLAVTPAGVVLDGHERLRIAHELELAEVPVRVEEPPDELDYILRAMLLRKHLNPGQRAAFALEFKQLGEQRAQARARQLANLKQNAEVAKLPPRGKTRDSIADALGVSARTVQDAATVQEHDAELFEQVKRGEVAVSAAALRARRERRYAEIGDAPPLPAGCFELIYADPPWQLGNPESAYAPENYYPTLPLEEIKALPVPAADAAVLLLWAVNGHLPQAFEVMSAWGFTYRAEIAWAKNGIGLGVWVRHRHEPLLMGTKGGFPPPEPRARIDSVIEAKRGRHSAKPAVVYELLERMYPDASRLELFARGTPRPGRSAWGNEVVQ